MLIPRLDNGKKYVTRPDFARYMGVSKERIYDAIKRGDIKTTKRNGKVMIDFPSEAPRFMAVSETARKYTKLKRTTGEEYKSPNGRKPKGYYKGQGRNPEVLLDGIGKSREAQEKYKALKLEADYKQRMGALIETEQVKKDWLSIVTMIRKSIVGISDRVAPIVAPETDEHTVHRIIEDECTLILENLSREIESRSEVNPSLGDCEGGEASEETDDY